MRRARVRASRGATEVGILLVVAGLIAGVLFGSGLADTALQASDGLAWLGDDTRGEAVQVNPVTGRPETRLAVAAPGQQWRLAQRDGLLVITQADGTVALIDVATLSIAGRYRATASAKVLLDATGLYVADRGRGSIARLDPATAATVGTAWAAGLPLADAALDDAATVWALTISGTLHQLIWTGTGLADATTPRQIPGAGPASRLVAHEQGVTVLVAEAGTAVRVGTGADTILAVPQFGDGIYAPDQAPADLVPVSVESTATVVLLVDSSRVIPVDMTGLGCARPGQPAVYAGRVHVPCRGAGRVIVLDPTGRHLPPDIDLGPGGDPSLILDEGRLFVTIPGTTTGVVIAPNGTRKTITTFDEATPVRDPEEKPEPPQLTDPPPWKDRLNPPPPEEPPPNQPRPSRTSNDPTPLPDPTQPPSAGPPPPTTSPAPPPPPATTSPAPPPPPPPATTSSAQPPAPTNVAATARSDASVLVTWTRQGSPTNHRILRGDTGATVATVPGSAASATVTTVAPATTLRFYVEAVSATGSTRSTASNTVTVYTRPGAPGSVTVGRDSATSSSITVTASWGAAAANGSPVSGYAVVLRTDRGVSTSRNTTGLSTGPVTLSCSGSCAGGIQVTATVTASNAAGTGPAATGSHTYNPPSPPNITYMQCEYLGLNDRFTCSVSNDGGSGSIRWTIDGRSISGWNDRTSGLYQCTHDTRPRVQVTITNVSGSDSASDSFRCGGPPL